MGHQRGAARACLPLRLGSARLAGGWVWGVESGWWQAVTGWVGCTHALYWGLQARVLLEAGQGRAAAEQAGVLQASGEGRAAAAVPYACHLAREHPSRAVSRLACPLGCVLSDFFSSCFLPDLLLQPKGQAGN